MPWDYEQSESYLENWLNRGHNWILVLIRSEEETNWKPQVWGSYSEENEVQLQP
jgi:hypothetical protein